MTVAFGFVSICLSEHRCSPAGNLTVSSLAGLERDVQLGRIRRTARRNLENTLRILWFMKAHGIPLYRLATHLVPLVTHPLTEGWLWQEDPDLVPLFEKIGAVARENGFRLSTHPPQLCVLNSSDPETFRWVVGYLDYHDRLFERMDLGSEAKTVLHPGAGYGDLDAAAARVVENVEQLPGRLRRRLVLENDDTTFSAAQTLALCRRLALPMVFDLHHHQLRNDGEDYHDLLPEIFATWRDRPPKVHLSSPAGGGDPRRHADYVDPGQALPFLRYAAGLGPVDVMVEAKKKDLAALRLREQYERAQAPAPG